jgi:hypothetical protein
MALQERSEHERFLSPPFRRLSHVLGLDIISILDAVIFFI